MTGQAALLSVVLPAAAAVAGLATGRSRTWAREWGVLGAVGALAAAVAERITVVSDGDLTRIPFLGEVDTGAGVAHLSLRSDDLSSLVAIAVALVACCVQVYSAAYLHEPAHAPAAAPGSHRGPHPPSDADPAPTRYGGYAATVSLFTAAMMLVVHADDLTLLLIGWEIMGACSYLLVGHHSERPAARAAAAKAFLVTRVGDLGLLLAVVVLLLDARTTALPDLVAQVRDGQLDGATLTVAAVLLLTAAAGKSAQFPLHTWLPDAMEGPTPVSALIHAATMVAAGVFLVARLLPLYLAAPVVLDVAAVIAAITMLGAALAALAQDDLKRLLAWSTVSQVAFMLAGVAVAADAAGPGEAPSAAPGVLHLLAHAGFKALLFLVAGCVTHLAGSTRMSDLRGLRATHPWLALAFGLGLAALAGVPPLSGFWSKEAVLSAAEAAAVDGGSWAAWAVLGSGLVTTVVTGVYAGRAWAVVALGAPAPALADATVHGDPQGDPPPMPDAAPTATLAPDPALVAGPAPAPLTERPAAPPPRLPRAMTWPLAVLAVPTVLLGAVLVRPTGVLAEVTVNPLTAVTGSLLSLAGIGWALTAPALGAADVADALPARLRAFLREGYRLDDVQHRLVVRPVRALGRVVVRGDHDVVDGYVRAGALLADRCGGLARRASNGLATGYLGWAAAGAVVLAAAGAVVAR